MTCCNLQKICAPFFQHYFEAKVGRGVLARIFNLSRAYSPFLHSSKSLIRMHEVNNHNDCCGFLEEQQLWWTCAMGNQQRLWEASKQLAPSVVTGDDPRDDPSLVPRLFFHTPHAENSLGKGLGQPCISLRSQCEQQKPWRWPAIETIVILWRS